MIPVRLASVLAVCFLLGDAPALAQPAATPPATRPTTQPAADARPNPLNAPGYRYPMVDPQGRAYFRIVAPDAQSVVIGVGRRFPLTKGEGGVWYGSSGDPLPVGFHYYNVYIDGAAGDQAHLLRVRGDGPRVADVAAQLPRVRAAAVPGVNDHVSEVHGRTTPCSDDTPS